MITMLMAGVVLSAECKIAKIEEPCRSTEDAGDAATDTNPDTD